MCLSLSSIHDNRPGTLLSGTYGPIECQSTWRTAFIMNLEHDWVSRDPEITSSSSIACQSAIRRLQSCSSIVCAEQKLQALYSPKGWFHTDLNFIYLYFSFFIHICYLTVTLISLIMTFFFFLLHIDVYKIFSHMKILNTF